MAETPEQKLLSKTQIFYCSFYSIAIILVCFIYWYQTLNTNFHGFFAILGIIIASIVLNISFLFLLILFGGMLIDDIVMRIKKRRTNIK